MKKRILILLLVAVIAICCLSGCGTSSNPADKAANEAAHFVHIDGKDYLSYSENTRVVYYMFSTAEASAHQGYGYAYFAPYISENGKFCKYVDGKIVEITDQVPNANN